MTRPRLATLALTAGLMALPAAAAPMQLYFFGDSLTDDGKTVGTFPLAPAFGAAPFPTSPPYAEGRYSNGPMWSERVADALGSPSDLDRNFAVGGATSRPIDDPADPVQTQANFSGQIDLFEATFGGFGPQDLAFVNFGGNDVPLIARAAGGDTALAGAGIAESVAAIGAGLDRLAALGARDVSMLAYPDLSLTPLATRDPAGVEASFGVTPADLDALVEDFNSALAAELAAFETRSGARTTLVDLNGLFDRLVASPGAFGLSTIEEPCLVSRSTATTPVFNPAIDCTDPAVAAATLFWDLEFHPTATGQQLIADAVLDARAPAIPLPGAGLLLVVALGALASCRRGAA